MDQNSRRFAIGTPTVAPVHERNECRGEFLASQGKSVLVAYRSILIDDLVDNVVVDKTLQTVSQEVLGDAKVALKE